LLTICENGIQENFWHVFVLALRKLRVMKTRFTLLIAFLGVYFQFFAAEYFLKINRSGNFQVSIGGQVQTNSTQVYRFFDLNFGNSQVTVTDVNTNSILFNNYVQLSMNTRTVAELDMYGNMSIVQNLPISVNNWYNTQIVGTVTNNTGGGYGNPTHGGGIINVNDPQTEAGFQQFLTFLDSQSFDSGKLEESKKYVALSNLSAQQISQIAKKFTYDSSRLEFAKAAYSTCRDKANYFLLKSTFSFSSSYSDLEEYIKTH